VTAVRISQPQGDEGVEEERIVVFLFAIFDKKDSVSALSSLFYVSCWISVGFIVLRREQAGAAVMPRFQEPQ
jgi:hypothetical protein